jgi:orotate phosphoribosyltransferase
VLIVDDVITAGTAVGESVQIIRAAGAVPAAVAVSLDRMERGKGELSAIQEVKSHYRMPVLTIATLDDLLRHLRGRADLRQNVGAIEQYRQLYGANQDA